MSEPGSTRLARPRGPFPRGTSAGFLGLTALSVGVPFSVMESAAPILPGGFELWLSSIPYVLGIGLLPIFVMIAGARSHRYWTICFFFYVGALLLVAYGLALAFALACLLGAFPVREQGLGAMSVASVVFAAALAPAAWVLLRAMRLRYWQPGAPAASWEASDETSPAWAMAKSDRL